MWPPRCDQGAGPARSAPRLRCSCALWSRSGALGLSACAFAAAQRAAQRLGFPSWDAAGLAGCAPDVLSEAIEDLESEE